MADRTAFLFGTKRYLSNVTPPAPQGSVNVVWTSDGENISASLAKAGAQTPWTQDIDAAQHQLTAVKYLEIDSPGTLGTNAGDRVTFSRFSAYDANLDFLDFHLLRTAAGSNWNTTVQRIQRVVDVSPHGYIEFGDASVALGSGNTGNDKIRVDNIGVNFLSDIWIKNGKSFARSIYWDGMNWRYDGTGYAGFFLGGGAASVDFSTCPSGAPGAIASPSQALVFSTNFAEVKRRLKSSIGTAHDSYPAANQWAGAVINYNDVSGEGGLIVANTWANSDTSCFLVGGVNGGWPGGFQALFSVQGAGQIYMPKLPTSASGLPSGALWRDAANGNVVKIVP